MSMRLINQKGLAQSSLKGFTLIELVAVIGVLVVVSGVLLVNNRLNESQLSLNTDAAGIAGAVSRAKALTLQNLSGDTCGYGVRFDVGSKSYSIFKDIKVDGVCDNIYTESNDEILPGQESQQNLGNNIIFYNPETSDSVYNLLITDVVFYSSDAKVKLTSFNDSDISPAGMVIIQTDTPSPSYKTLKITISGQVTTKSDRYATIENFDNGVLADEGEIGEGEEPLIIEDCIEDCSCAIGLASGLTCRGVCGGTCYAGGPGGLQCSPDPLDPNCKDSNNNNTCGDTDVCGAPCKTCLGNQICQNKVCIVYDCSGKNCGEISGGGSGLTCPGACPAGTGKCTLTSPYRCVVDSVGLRLDSIWPPATNKAQ